MLEQNITVAVAATNEHCALPIPIWKSAARTKNAHRGGGVLICLTLFAAIVMIPTGVLGFNCFSDAVTRQRVLTLLGDTLFPCLW